MKISLFTQFGALNSPAVFEAFAQGLAHLGISHNYNDMTADIAVIWSMVWAGRMKGNQAVWHAFRATKRPVIVLEVGMLKRGQTWKLGLNGTGINSYPKDITQQNRPASLGLSLLPWTNAGSSIIIATQRADSEQWQGLPDTDQWVNATVTTLKQYTDRPIIIRCHPRQRISPVPGCTMQTAIKIPNTYDCFDFSSALTNAWAVVNWNSGVGSQSIIAGVPSFTGPTSVAAPVANLHLNSIEEPCRPDRQAWLDFLSHTEWTVAEIATGGPIQRLLKQINFFPG